MTVVCICTCISIIQVVTDQSLNNSATEQEKQAWQGTGKEQGTAFCPLHSAILQLRLLCRLHQDQLHTSVEETLKTDTVESCIRGSSVEDNCITTRNWKEWTLHNQGSNSSNSFPKNEKKACSVTTNSERLERIWRTFNYYQEEIRQWAWWNLYTNSKIRLRRFRESWGHTATLMLPDYNLCEFSLWREAYCQMANVWSDKALQEHMQV